MQNPSYSATATIGGNSHSWTFNAFSGKLNADQSFDLTLTIQDQAGAAFDVSDCTPELYISGYGNVSFTPVFLATGTVSGAGSNIASFVVDKNQIPDSLASFEQDRYGSVIVYARFNETAGDANSYFQISERVNIDDADFGLTGENAPVVPAELSNYTVSTPSDWPDPDPTKVNEALDKNAARITVLENVSAPIAKLDATAPPVVSNDSTEGYSIGSMWIDVTGDESYRALDVSVGAAVWIKTTLSTDELASVAISGSAEDLTEGATKKLLTVAERAEIAANSSKLDTVVAGTNITVDNTDPLNPIISAAGGGGMLASVYDPNAVVGNVYDTDNHIDGTFSKVYSATDKTQVETNKAHTESAHAPSNATPDQSDAEIETAYNNQVSAASQGQMESGTVSNIMRMSPLRVKQAILALAPAAPTVPTDQEIASGTDNAQTGTSYTLVLTDADNKTVTMTNAAASTLTIPLNATVAFAVGTKIPITQYGAGLVTVDCATAGVTLNGTAGGTKDLGGQYTGALLHKIATDTWVVL